MTFDTVREAAKQPRTDPLVTVAIRSDGSVESVTIVQSSGVAARRDATHPRSTARYRILAKRSKKGPRSKLVSPDTGATNSTFDAAGNPADQDRRPR